eukprot:scaffold365998_cov37-Prasinocladus_malaysianus.AAC.2
MKKGIAAYRSSGSMLMYLGAAKPKNKIHASLVGNTSLVYGRQTSARYNCLIVRESARIRVCLISTALTPTRKNRTPNREQIPGLGDCDLTGGPSAGRN